MQTNKTEITGERVVIEKPYNSKCLKSKYGDHKFTFGPRNKISSGIFEVEQICIHCGGVATTTEDYNVLSGLF